MERRRTLLVELPYVSISLAQVLTHSATQLTVLSRQYILPEDSVVYIGCVGKDKEAETLEKASREQGVRVEYRYDEEQPTGRCGVVITGHNRSMCTDLAAANCYKLDHLKQPQIWKLVEQAKVYYVGGYHLTVCVPAIMALAEQAASENKVRLYLLTGTFLHINIHPPDLHPFHLGSFHPTILQGPARSGPPLLRLHHRQRNRSNRLR